MIVAAATVSETSSYADAPTTPAAVQLTGTITTLYQSFMPASKNAGKTVGGLEIYFNGWTLSPAQSATNLKEIVVFRDDISIVKPPSPPVSDKTGSCKVTLQTNVNSTAAVQMLEVTVTEPGCDSIELLKETLPHGLHVRAMAVWKPTGATVPVALDLRPKP